MQLKKKKLRKKIYFRKIIEKLICDLSNFDWASTNKLK